MIKTSGLLLILILLFGKVYAQNTSVTGKLIDSESKLPVQNANVTAYDGKKVVYHTTTDSAGNFAIPKTLLIRSNYIGVNSLSYNELRIDINPDNYITSKANVDLGIFKLSPHQIELKEVTIHANKRYRDTTKINLSNKKFDRSLMIDDFFSDQSGFTKDNKGQIFYKGKQVTDLVVNGGNFFGKNNTDIYQLLPALVLDNIEVVETNIDSITNTTLITPHLKVNLKFKEKYNKGKLGDVNLGAGTARRYIANTGLYSYKDKEQVSLSLNSNNINVPDNTIVQPRIDFAATGNNVTTNNARFTYRNLYSNKIEVNFAIKAKVDDKNYTSESERQEEDLNIFSKTYNSSKIRSFSIDNGNFNINYRIDTLNTLDITQTFNHLHTRQADSLNYFIKTDSSLITSLLNKVRTINNDLYSTHVNYQRKYSSKKGRSLTVDAWVNNNKYAINEHANVYNTLSQTISKYFVEGHREASEHKYNVNMSYIEPLSDSTYLNVYAFYELHKLNYAAIVGSDTVLISHNESARLTNNYIRPGINFQKIFKKYVFNAAASGLLDLRNIEQTGQNYTNSFFNLNLDIKLDYKLNKTKSLIVDYNATTNYPDIGQLTSLNNSFDLISQTSSNFYLKPQEKNTLKLDYSVKPSDSENIIISGQFDHYSSTFGYSVNTSSTFLQTSKTENIGNSNSGQLSFSFLKNITNEKYFNYTNAIAYQESPTITNNKLTRNNGVVINQSISTSLTIIKSVFTISPILASSYSKYFYETGAFNILTFTYSDKLSFQTKGYQLSLYPLFNFNHSITNNHSFSTNGELRKNFLKKYGTVWVQAYDIFNSFKFYNNNVGATYYQTVRYSNVERYIIIGLSFKFNNIK